MAAFGHRLDVAGNRGVSGPGVTPAVVEVEFVFERDALLVDKDLLADGHCVDEALRDGLGRVRCVVLRLVIRRAGSIVESKALAERQDEVDEVGVGGNHRCEKIGLSCRR